MSETATLDLGDQIAALAADLDCLDGRALAERLQHLERLQRTLEHAVVGVVRSADRRGVWTDDGHRSVRGWCQATVNWSYGETTHRIRTVTVLDDLSGVDEALAGGEVGVAQVRELARVRANPRCGSELVDCEQVLLDDARQLPFDEFRLCVQHWEAAADADGAHRDHEQTHENRRASFNQVGNGYLLNGEGGVAQGATMKEIFDAFCDAEFR
ncbi:MAG: DUF222 domain-containing protein, partial [Acidimicrobiales bacterium]